MSGLRSSVRKAIECEIPTIAEARHTAGKANLVTEE
jgi:hypothetical protein